MPSSPLPLNTPACQLGNHTSEALPQPVRIEIALLTGGSDRHYAFGLTMALASRGVFVEVVGSDDVDSSELHNTSNVKFLNFQPKPQTPSLARRIARVLRYYVRLIRYVTVAKPGIFHILWNNKLELFDRTFLMLYHKLQGKKIVLTVHNVNAGVRDGNDSLLNRLTLRMQYRLADHLFVHTEQMKAQLLRVFGVAERVVSVIPYGINNSVPDTDLSSAEAKRRLGVKETEKIILFYGAIWPYKGLEYLVEAYLRLAASNSEYRLVIAGEPKRGSEQYLKKILQMLSDELLISSVIQKLQYIPDKDTELYFKAADVLVLPYTYIFQSGVLFLAYSFGLPVVATDVGCFRDDIIAGKTGFLCKPCDSAELARALETYFESDLFKSLGTRRQDVKDYAVQRHSWDTVAEITRAVYLGLGEANQ
jgi:glycosyltransferase involved in cell wall biosynthesis